MTATEYALLFGDEINALMQDCCINVGFSLTAKLSAMSLSFDFTYCIIGKIT